MKCEPCGSSDDDWEIDDTLLNQGELADRSLENRKCVIETSSFDISLCSGIEKASGSEYKRIFLRDLSLHPSKSNDLPYHLLRLNHR